MCSLQWKCLQPVGRKCRYPYGATRQCGIDPGAPRYCGWPEVFLVDMEPQVFLNSEETSQVLLYSTVWLVARVHRQCEYIHMLLDSVDIYYQLLGDTEARFS